VRLALAVLGIGLVLPSIASARVERFAVLIGNDLGHADETPLRYAASDASRMHEVLRDLGGFEPFNMVLLRNEDAPTARRTLLTINERVREAVAQPDTDVMLLVYYSGHSDNDMLHLGTSEMPIHELAQIVRGSAAKFRLVVLDACKSGALTRLKGGRVVDPFALPDARLPGEGLAYLTSSSSSEDAQESDRLQASFFTHALISGLLGAADRDDDGEVVLDEAYRYAYDATLRATSRTAAGTQHPTFRYDFRGSGEVVLTRPADHQKSRTRLRFPPGLDFMIMREHAEGAVVGELSGSNPQRQLSVRPGRYFIRARASDVLLEGAIVAAPGASHAVDTDAMERIEYARLVRKGGRSDLAHGPEAGFRLRTALPSEDRPCLGAFAGYALHFEDFGTRMRLSGCRSGFDNETLSATSTAIDAEGEVFHAWDSTSALSLELGLGGGAALWFQNFDTAGEAPTKRSLVPFLAVTAAAGFDLGAGFQLALHAAAETHFIPLQASAWEDPSTDVGFALRTTLQLAKYF
jgi:hypothetical protein